MKNKIIFPFSRNNYYHGKLLTVKDFKDEQDYFNDKRRLINKFLHGAGVVSGLKVISLDLQHISIEPGMAIDYLGREIVIDKPVVKKLNTIHGFDSANETDILYLYLEYNEENKKFTNITQSSNEDENNNHNKVEESYTFKLTDTVHDSDALTPLSMYRVNRNIFSNNDIKINIYVSKYAQYNKNFELYIEVEKKESDMKVSIEGELELENFKNISGTSTTYININDISGEMKSIYKYKLKPKNVPEIDGNIKISKEKFKVKIDDQVYKLGSDHNFEVSIIKKPVTDEIKREYYDKDFYKFFDNDTNLKVYLAQIDLIKKDDVFIINNVSNLPFNQRVYNTQLLNVLNKADAVTTDTSQKENNLKGISEDEENIEVIVRKYNDLSSEGEFEIDFKGGSKKGSTYISNEISHDLGLGAVDVRVGLKDDMLGKDVLAFGDTHVFNNTEHELSIPKNNLGILVYPDRGTFRVGVTLLENTIYTKLKVNWWARRKNNISNDLKKDENKIIITPHSIVLKPKEKVRFNASILGIRNQEVKWLLKEKNSGIIDGTGLYEAPSYSGVFEIVAESVEKSDVKASSYVVVKESL